MGSSISHTKDATWADQFNTILKDSQGSPEKQLMTLRAVTAISGVVHEAQLLQLKLWGAVAFGHTGKCGWTASVDVATKTVVYVLVSKKHPKELAKYVAVLDNSIHWLFGDNWALQVREAWKKGTKSLYQGQRKQSNVNNERKQRTGDREGG